MKDSFYKNWFKLAVIVILLVTIAVWFHFTLSEKEQQKQVNNINLQERCASNAKSFFNENWQSADSNDILLDYQNHYNTKLNECYVLINYNFWVVKSTGLYSKNTFLYSVADRIKLAEMTIGNNSVAGTQQEVLRVCDFSGKQCTSASDFQSMLIPFMNN